MGLTGEERRQPGTGTAIPNEKTAGKRCLPAAQQKQGIRFSREEKPT
jgi:hypothetical protein